MPLYEPERPASDATPANIGTAAAGTGTTDSRSDHVHATGAGTPSTQAMGDSATVGTGPAAAMTDHKHAMPAFGTTTASVGTAAGGSATTPSKSDHVHATGAGTPSTQAFGDAAAVGSGPAGAMTDHKHAMPNSTAGPDGDITIDAAGAAGTASTAARAAHGHKLATYSSAATAIGTAAAGTSTTAPSRGDHVHNASGDTPSTQAFGDAAAAGSSAKAAQSDHKHAMPPLGATYQATPGDPTGTASSNKMMGLAGSITPAATGRIFVSIGAKLSSSSTSTTSIIIRYGTGSAPTNGAAATGTAAGTKAEITTNNSGQQMYACANAVITGLSVGTAYWLDVEMVRSAGTGAMNGVNISAHEI